MSYFIFEFGLGNAEYASLVSAGAGSWERGITAALIKLGVTEGLKAKPEATGENVVRLREGHACVLLALGHGDPNVGVRKLLELAQTSGGPADAEP